MNDRSSTTNGIQPTLEQELAAVMARLRGCVLEVFGELGADPSHPREAARTLGLDKSLAWKFCRIAQTANAIDGAPLVPGGAGVRIALSAFEGAGASPAACLATQAAIDEFDRVVKIHAGDRRTLDLVVSNLGTSDPARKEQQRRQSFDGNSATWGVQAKTQVTTTIVVPNADDPERCDLARVGGVVDFRRLRGDARWPLFRRYDRQDDGTAAGESWTAIDERHDFVDRLPILEDFTTHPLPRIDCTRAGDQYTFELPPGRIGNTATLTCMYGAMARSIFPLRRDTHNEHLDVATNLLTPVEAAVTDVLVHESIAWAAPPTCEVISLLNGGDIRAGARSGSNRLPVNGDVVDLGRGLQGMATARVPRYRQMLSFVCERFGWDTGAFRGLRFSVAYPPIPTAALVSFALPT